MRCPGVSACCRIPNEAGLLSSIRVMPQAAQQGRPWPSETADPVVGCTGCSPCPLAARRHCPLPLLRASLLLTRLLEASYAV